MQGRFELEAAARHIARFGQILQLQLSFGRNLVTILGDGLPDIADAPAQTPLNQALGLRAAAGERTRHQQLVSAHQ
jgi:hypothetical protein